MKIHKIKFEEGAKPEPHELQTASVLNKLGKEIKFLAPKNLDHIKTPDILMDHLKWEIKSPKSSGSRAMEQALRSATKQSPNVIIDLRRCKLKDERAISQINATAYKRTAIKRLLVITKAGEVLDLK
ncbi:MAG: hypothetical protein LBV19_05845 [Streptococcaceae bacterium]|jgi:hypothetical protein|nr:hypothetical protein [Streptococcaceae bacterium]